MIKRIEEEEWREKKKGREERKILSTEQLPWNKAYIGEVKEVLM